MKYSSKVGGEFVIYTLTSESIIVDHENQGGVKFEMSLGHPDIKVTEGSEMHRLFFIGLWLFIIPVFTYSVILMKSGNLSSLYEEGLDYSSFLLPAFLVLGILWMFRYRGRLRRHLVSNDEGKNGVRIFLEVGMEKEYREFVDELKRRIDRS